MLWRTTVQKAVGFSPREQQAQAGDAMFWYNEDKDEPHQPVPDTGTWNITKIPGGNPSDQLALNNPGTFSYHCAIHPDEKGSIIVANAVLIAGGANPLFGSTQLVQGQAVSWGNSSADDHQPAPVGGDPWCNPVGSGDLSAPVDFPDAGNINYYCALHPDNSAETGTLIVAKQLTIESGATFPSATVVQNGGIAFLNNDSKSHQPVPDSGGTTWFRNPIGAGSLSGIVILGTAGSIAYHCALHPDNTQEKGTITVTAS